MTKEQLEKMSVDRIGVSTLKNVSKEDAVWSYDGKLYGLKAGEKKVLPNYLAALMLEHCKQLVVEGEEVEQEEKKEIPTLPENITMPSAEAIELAKTKEELASLKKELEELKKLLAEKKTRTGRKKK